MAKATVVKGRKGAGFRYCPACDHSTTGPRSTNCAKCGKAFETTKPKTKTTTAKTPSPLLAVQATVEAIQDLGGLAEVERMIEAADRLAKLGGLAEAKQAVEVIRGLSDLLGGK